MGDAEPVENRMKGGHACFIVTSPIRKSIDRVNNEQSTVVTFCE